MIRAQCGILLLGCCERGGGVDRASGKGRRVRRPLALLAFLTLIAVGVVAVYAAAANLTVRSDRLTTFGTNQAASASCSPAVADDAYVDQKSTASNFGSAATLNVASRSNRNKRSYVRFDVASCAIPSGSTVMSASVALAVASAPAKNRTYGMHVVDGTFSWAEATLTWNSQSTSPFAATATDSQSVTTGSTGTVVGWDVRPDVQAFVAGTRPNNGWVLRDATESANPASETQFRSDESTSPPALTITYST